jgi:glycerol uptake facilitator-like aquaporin
MWNESQLATKSAAEFVGTSLLLATVVGSGIMGDRLAGGNQAIALIANSLATGGALFALILTFGPISGSHLNPLVSLADTWQGGISSLDAQRTRSHSFSALSHASASQISCSVWQHSLDPRTSEQATRSF